MLVALLQPCIVELGASQFCSRACLCLSCSLPWAARAMLDPMGMRRSYVGDEVATHTARDGEIQLLLVCCCTHQPLAAPTRHPWVVHAMLMRRCSLTRSRMLLTSCCTPCRSHDPSCSLLGGNLGTVGPTRCSQAAAPHAGAGASGMDISQPSSPSMSRWARPSKQVTSACMWHVQHASRFCPFKPLLSCPPAVQRGQ